MKYIHHNVDTMERMELIRNLRLGLFDVLVGINLLREGIDLPEVTLVAILDADKEGLFRSTRSLIQMIGRAARNVGGRVILYADHVTDSMKEAMDETERRREIQLRYNLEHGIIPKTIEKKVGDLIQIGADDEASSRKKGKRGKAAVAAAAVSGKSGASAGKAAESTEASRSVEAQIARLTAEMKQAAAELRFEEAAFLRDKIRELQK